MLSLLLNAPWTLLQVKKATAIFAKVAQAYEVLSDPTQRKRYRELLGQYCHLAAVTPSPLSCGQHRC